MKKLLLSIFLVASVSAFAEEILPFTNVKQNTYATYALYNGNNKTLNMGLCYWRFYVFNVAESTDGSKKITYRVDILDKNMRASKYSNMSGTSNGYYYAVDVDAQGGYKMDQDMMWGIYPEMARGGFMFEIPAHLTVGQTLQSSTVKQEFRFSGRKQSSEITYYNVRVEREEDVIVKAGMVHCFVITGFYTGKVGTGGALSTTQLSSTFTMWIAAGLGVVKYETQYGGLRTFELYEVYGL